MINWCNLNKLFFAEHGYEILDWNRQTVHLLYSSDQHQEGNQGKINTYIGLNHRLDLFLAMLITPYVGQFLDNHDQLPHWQRHHDYNIFMWKEIIGNLSNQKVINLLNIKIVIADGLINHPKRNFFSFSGSTNNPLQIVCLVTNLCPTCPIFIQLSYVLIHWSLKHTVVIYINLIITKSIW